MAAEKGLVVCAALKGGETSGVHPTSTRPRSIEIAAAFIVIPRRKRAVHRSIPVSIFCNEK